MKKDTLQDNWDQLRSAIKQRWGALTDKDLDTVNGNLDHLTGLLLARYGHAREQAEKEIDLFLSNMKQKVENPVEIVRETLTDSTPEEEAHIEKKEYKG